MNALQLLQKCVCVILTRVVGSGHARVDQALRWQTRGGDGDHWCGQSLGTAYPLSVLHTGPHTQS